MRRAEVKRPWTVVVGLLLVFGTTACAPMQPKPAPVPAPPAAPETSAGPDLPGERAAHSRPGNPPFYEVFGRRYHVMDSSSGYQERGVASWYGTEFHGRPTANGETFDMHGMTAAHKSLPLPTNARVTNLSNGRSVMVRINDRGPFVKNRLIDLSYGAAKALGLLGAGTGLVEVTAVTAREEPATPDLATPAEADAVITSAVQEAPLQRALFLQVGAFGEPFNAERMRQRLYSYGYDNVFVHSDMLEERQLFRVRLGPISGVEEYDRLVEEMRALDIVDTYLAVQ